VGLLFLIPGIDETLRVNGTALVSDDPALLAPFASERHPPHVVVRVAVQQAYLHCAKAFMRSRLWSAAAQVERSALPTIGRMINDQLGLTTPSETQEAMLARYAKDL
jgi:predicted pyridoxine 5'-phosphate oxidase superfamily flavin-nucleotide-binding protein